MGAGQGERVRLHLPYGVSVWLCGAHRSAEFQTGGQSGTSWPR